MNVPLTEEKALAADAIYSVDALRRFACVWVKDQVPLTENICVALAFHVVLFPIIWFQSWILPWPKSPVITTVIEINLENWPREAKSKKLFEYRNPELNR